MRCRLWGVQTSHGRARPTNRQIPIEFWKTARWVISLEKAPFIAPPLAVHAPQGWGIARCATVCANAHFRISFLNKTMKKGVCQRLELYKNKSRYLFLFLFSHTCTISLVQQTAFRDTISVPQVRFIPNKLWSVGLLLINGQRQFF